MHSFLDSRFLLVFVVVLIVVFVVVLDDVSHVVLVVEKIFLFYKTFARSHNLPNYLPT